MTSSFKEFEKFVEDQVWWQQGIGYEWVCAAIIGPQVLADLVLLASKAPKQLREDFLNAIPLTVLPEI